VIAPEIAYARCEQITRHEARNFAYGIRLLPPAKRQAMSALYAFARRVDDIGDGAAAVEVKLAQLAETRSTLVQVVAGDPPADDAVLVALADALARFPIPVGALDEVVAGCEMDCATSRYATFDELSQYCRLVAGSIGRLSLGVFGPTDPDRGPGLADTLGLALQLTNILRDIVEDRDVMGRVYLPEEDLLRFGCAADASGPNAALVELVRFECGRARALYGEGLELLGLLDRRSRACVSAMAGIYFRLLGRIESEPLAVLDHRVSVPTMEKLAVAARSLAGLT
jgi:15-cis-phytoene synthase